MSQSIPEPTLILLDTRTSKRSFEGIAVYVPIILLGGGLLIAGAIIEQAQQELWLAALFINIVAAALGSRTVYQVDAKHFAKRHGLIMIIALGEAIIAVGATLADQLPSSEIATHLAIGLALAMTLYWAYFDRAKQSGKTLSARLIRLRPENSPETSTRSPTFQ